MIFLARSITGKSTIFPSSLKAYDPLVSAWDTTRVAQSSSWDDGANALCTPSTWAGCMHSITPKPISQAKRAAAARPEDSEKFGETLSIDRQSVVTGKRL